MRRPHLAGHLEGGAAGRTGSAAQALPALQAAEQLRAALRPQRLCLARRAL